MNYYIMALKKYAVFTGRASRSEYWYFALFNIIFSIVAGIIDTIINDQSDILRTLYGLAVLVPGLAVGVRRLHDTNRSGYTILLCLIPIIGWIALIYMYCLDSTPGDNMFGPNPKGVASAPGTPPAPTPTI